MKGTLNYGLFYSYDADITPKGYYDADWVGSPHDRRSISGFVFMLGDKTISWSSKKQPTVALSSREAKYRALSHAACEGIWLKKLLTELGLYTRSMMLLCDNMSSIYLALRKVCCLTDGFVWVHHIIQWWIMET